MSINTKMQKSAGRPAKRGASMQSFRRDTKGNVAIIFAMSATIITGVVGAAVDYGRAIQTRSEMQAAMDAAVLAAARTLQTENDGAQAQAKAQAQYAAMTPSVAVVTVPNIVVDEFASTVKGTAVADVPAPFMFLHGSQKITVSVESMARFRNGKYDGNGDGTSIEVSLMLDVTGSMCSPCSKIDALKAAAKDLINIVVWDDQSQFTSRVALVPFSYSVNVGPYYKKATGNDPSSSSRTCVKERPNSNRYTDKRPNNNNGYFDGYSGNCNMAEIMPLTSNKTALNAHIDSLTTGGMTAGHLGTQWAWYTLSRTFNNLWPSANEPADYPSGHASSNPETQAQAYKDAQLKKIAVLMTDGVYNQWYSGSSSKTQALEHCAGMKARGIEVFTVGFELPDQATKDMLKTCASGDDHFYDAVNEAKLRESFRDIATKLIPLALTE